MFEHSLIYISGSTKTPMTNSIHHLDTLEYLKRTRKSIHYMNDIHRNPHHISLRDSKSGLYTSLDSSCTSHVRADNFSFDAISFFLSGNGINIREDKHSKVDSYQYQPTLQFIISPR